MSAYALSFTSYLPPVTKSTTPQSLCNNNRIDNENESLLSYNQPVSAVHVEIKSAMIDAGALVRPSRRSKINNSTTNKYFSLPDDAVVFKLSINFNGRKYNASRSFDKFVKFRRDLVKELKHANGTRNAMNGHGHSHGQSHAHAHSHAHSHGHGHSHGQNSHSRNDRNRHNSNDRDKGYHEHEHGHEHGHEHDHYSNKNTNSKLHHH